VTGAEGEAMKIARAEPGAKPQTLHEECTPLVRLGSLGQATRPAGGEAVVV